MSVTTRLIMGTMWDDIPPWVDANNSSGPTPNIPPPPDATMLSTTQEPYAAPMNFIITKNRCLVRVSHANGRSATFPSINTPS
ncbi:hypothetical protein BS17DRAFT_818664 [Gyrodon lividus]|nr:hypothetical protein BS17DRAFT_818664 [Gyrodon lividus]